MLLHWLEKSRKVVRTKKHLQAEEFDTIAERFLLILGAGFKVKGGINFDTLGNLRVAFGFRDGKPSHVLD